MNPELRLSASFQATSAKFDLSMDSRMGRPMFGLVGKGELALSPQGLDMTARRHRYGLNLGAGAVAALALVALLLLSGDPKAIRFAFHWVVWLFAFVIGAGIASSVTRFTKPARFTFDRMRIERVLVKEGAVACIVRLCMRGGDVEVCAAPADASALVHALASWGLPIGRI